MAGKGPKNGNGGYKAKKPVRNDSSGGRKTPKSRDLKRTNSVKFARRSVK